MNNNAILVRINSHQTAFMRLKEALVSLQSYLDYSRKSDISFLTNDSSKVGLGAVLSTSKGTIVEYAVTL